MCVCLCWNWKHFLKIQLIKAIHFKPQKRSQMHKRNLKRILVRLRRESSAKTNLQSLIFNEKISTIYSIMPCLKIVKSLVKFYEDFSLWLMDAQYTFKNIGSLRYVNSAWAYDIFYHLCGHYFWHNIYTINYTISGGTFHHFKPEAFQLLLHFSRVFMEHFYGLNAFFMRRSYSF